MLFTFFMYLLLSLAEEFNIVYVGDVLETDFQEAASFIQGFERMEKDLKTMSAISTAFFHRS